MDNDNRENENFNTGAETIEPDQTPLDVEQKPVQETVVQPEQGVPVQPNAEYATQQNQEYTAGDNYGNGNWNVNPTGKGYENGNWNANGTGNSAQNNWNQYQNMNNQSSYGNQYQNVNNQGSYGNQYQNANNQNNYGNQYGQQGYGQQNYQPDQEPKESKGFGIAALVLGIISVVLFCTCINLPLAALAIIFAIVQLVKGGKKGLAIGGLVTGIISIVCCIIFWAAIFTSGSTAQDIMDQYGNGFYDYGNELQLPDIYDDITGNSTF